MLAGGVAALVLGVGVQSTTAATLTNGTLTVIEDNAPAETHIFFNAQVGTLNGTGHVGSQGGTSLLNFATDVAATFANGYATIDPTTASVIKSLTITSTTGLQWNDLVFRAQGPAGNVPTDLTVSAYLANALLGSVTFNSIGNGAKEFLAFITLNGLMDKLVLTSNLGISQFKQFEISLSAVPLPPAALLFGSALIGLGTLVSRRRRQAKLPVV
jgi:hypothetical protein